MVIQTTNAYKHLDHIISYHIISHHIIHAPIVLKIWDPQPLGPLRTWLVQGLLYLYPLYHILIRFPVLWSRICVLGLTAYCV